MGRSPWLVAAATVIALVGCGGGDDQSATTAASSTTTSTTASAPKAAKPVTELVSAIEQLKPHGGCEQVVKLINPADLIEPEGGASPANCDAIRSLVVGLPWFKPSDSAEFGTGGVIDGTSAGKPIALEAALDQTEHFKLTGGETLKPQVGTDASPDVDFEAPAASLVKALREDDCKAAYAAISSVISRLALSSEKQFCASFETNYMTDSAGLGARLQADPSADLIDFGGTANAHFFGLATKPAGYRTIVVGTVDHHGEPLVLDVLPVER